MVRKLSSLMPGDNYQSVPVPCLVISTFQSLLKVMLLHGLYYIDLLMVLVDFNFFLRRQLLTGNQKLYML